MKHMTTSNFNFSFFFSSILQNLAEHEYKIRYLVATDTSKDTLVRITRRISQILGSGRITFIDQENAMLNNDITVIHFRSLFFQIDKMNFFCLISKTISKCYLLIYNFYQCLSKKI